MTTHDYSTGTAGEIVEIYNGQPYPVVVTSEGHALGGRESALVDEDDPVVVKVLAKGWCSVIARTASAPAPSRKRKRDQAVEETPEEAPVVEAAPVEVPVETPVEPVEAPQDTNPGF